MRLVDRFIAWAQAKEMHPVPVVRHEDGQHILDRYQPFWPDEFISKGHGRHFNRPPWWRPFNILLHRWIISQREEMHDHPRWSITICLKGRMIEHTPWGSRILTPGSIVVRSRKAIHALEILPSDGETWTMFIVGRRNHQQSGFLVMPFGKPRPTISWPASSS